MATKTLTFDTGLVTYEINGTVKVKFNPTDAAFVERMYGTFTALSDKQDEFQKRVDEIGEDGEKMLVYARERDQEMRGLIDGLLGDGVADALFSDMNCYALADGLPVWINLMFAIATEVDEAFGEERKKADPRVRGYSKKYQGMMAKYKKGKR